MIRIYCTVKTIYAFLPIKSEIFYLHMSIIIYYVSQCKILRIVLFSCFIIIIMLIIIGQFRREEHLTIWYTYVLKYLKLKFTYILKIEWGKKKVTFRECRGCVVKVNYADCWDFRVPLFDFFFFIISSKIIFIRLILSRHYTIIWKQRYFNDCTRKTIVSGVSGVNHAKLLLSIIRNHNLHNDYDLYK